MRYVVCSLVLPSGHALLRYLPATRPWGWYVARQRGCVVDSGGPFRTEAVALAAA